MVYGYQEGGDNRLWLVINLLVDELFASVVILWILFRSDKTKGYLYSLVPKEEVHRYISNPLSKEFTRFGLIGCGVILGHNADLYFSYKVKISSLASYVDLCQSKGLQIDNKIAQDIMMRPSLGTQFFGSVLNTTGDSLKAIAGSIGKK
jgi:hypothetical protein